MHKFTFGLSMIALIGIGAASVLPRAEEKPAARVASRLADLTAAGVDYSPVGTATQIARIKRAKLGLKP